MRNEKTIEIQTGKKTVKKITVFEVRVKDALALLQEVDSDLPLMTVFEKALPMCCDASIADLKKFYPSDIEALLEGFKEVNAPFLRMARTLNLGPVAEKMRTALMKDFAVICAGLLPGGTPMRKTTGTGSS